MYCYPQVQNLAYVRNLVLDYNKYARVSPLVRRKLMFGKHATGLERLFFSELRLEGLALLGEALPALLPDLPLADLCGES